MKLINPIADEKSRPRSFYTYKIPFECLCRCTATYPGVEFTRRRQFLWSREDVKVEFPFNGHDFKIETIGVDTYVCPKDVVSVYPEIVEIEEHVERNGAGRCWTIESNEFWESEKRRICQ